MPLKIGRNAYLLKDDELGDGGFPAPGPEAKVCRAVPEADGRELEEIPAQHELHAPERFGDPLKPVRRRRGERERSQVNNK